jgi:hypothetical protein
MNNIKIEKTLMTLFFFTVHALHLHSFPFQDNKMFLNWLKLAIFKKSSNSTYEELLHIAKVPSLQIWRMRTMTLECFKVLYKLSPPCLNDLVVLKNSEYSFRYSNIVEIPTFKYTAAVLWNDLPDDFLKIANFNRWRQFIQYFKTF